MDLHIWPELLSCWFHFRITLPHVHWLSDYFLIKIGRDGTITGLGFWPSQDMQYCASQPPTVWYWTWLSLWLKDITSSTSHWKNDSICFRPPSPGNSVRRSSSKRGTRPHQEVPSPCRKFCYTIDWKSTPASTRALEIWADCWKWTLSAGRERKRKVTKSPLHFSGRKGGKGTRRKGLFEVLGFSIPFRPRQVSCGKATLFYWSKCNSLAPHAFVLSVVKLQTCLWY